uniref:Uncharacterized protein n=1 Tax=Plectus sambesii TaxID=2011161 RepID=A0A914WU32_9BILA
MAHRSIYVACGLLLCFGFLRELNNSGEMHEVETDLTNGIASNSVEQDDSYALLQLNEQIAKIKGINGTHAFNEGGYEGTIKFQQIRATSFKSSATNFIRFSEPNSINFEFKDVEAVIRAKFLGKSGFFNVPGTVRANLSQVTTALTANIEISHDNQAKVVLKSNDLTLTDGALETARYFGVQIINELISTVRGFSSTHKILRSGIDGTVKVHDVVARVTRVPDVSGQLKAASMVLLELNNLDIAMDGKFAGTAGWFSTNGVVHGDMKNVKIVVQSSIVRMPNDQMVVKMDECQTVVGQSKFTIKAKGMLGSLAKNFEGPLNKDVAVKLPNMMCEGLKQIIDKRGSKLFARLLKAPINKAFKKTEKTETFIKKFKH